MDTFEILIGALIGLAMTMSIAWVVNTALAILGAVL